MANTDRSLAGLQVAEQIRVVSVAQTLATVTGMYIAAVNLYSSQFIRTSAWSIYFFWLIKSIVVPCLVYLIILAALSFSSLPNSMLNIDSQDAFKAGIFALLYCGGFLSPALLARLIYIGNVNLAVVASLSGLVVAMSCLVVGFAIWPFYFLWPAAIGCWNLTIIAILLAYNGRV